MTYAWLRTRRQAMLQVAVPRIGRAEETAISFSISFCQFPRLNGPEMLCWEIMWSPKAALAVDEIKVNRG